MNIFENAYFGKAYKTRDGKKAIYLRGSYKHHLYIETGGILDCNQDGTYEGILGKMENFDIISEYNPEVNEEELEKLAMIEGAKAINHFINIEQSKFAYEWADLVKEAYKAGYRKAKQEQL